VAADACLGSTARMEAALPEVLGDADADSDGAYLALCSRDARFDGRLFVGVTSTRIYCRTICPVRTPLRRHCRFYTLAAAAERDGFRPCLRCRPELAPGLSRVDTPATLAHEAARLMQTAVMSGEPLDMPTLAARVGVTDRHLRRIFQGTHGVAPLAFLTTQRLLWAKQLLTDTRRPIADIALASGFGSLRRFHAVFSARYRLQPTQLRRQSAGAGPVQPGLGGHAHEDGADALRLSWRPPYDVDALLRFQARRAIDGLERVDLRGRRWGRTWREPFGGRILTGWVSCRFERDRAQVQVQISASLGPALGSVLSRVRACLDLDAQPRRFEPVLRDMERTLGWPVREGTRLPTSPDGFEAAVRILLGQQVSVAAARTLTQRLVTRHGQRIATTGDVPWAGLTHLFPDAATLAHADPADLGALGIVRQRVRALQALAQAVAHGTLRLDRDAPLEATRTALLDLPGIGAWTAELITLRALGWPDAWPARDLAVLGVLDARHKPDAAQRAQAWRPWRSYALMRLWHHLEEQA